MNKTSVPRAYGVFKPVGHIVIAFPSADDCTSAYTEFVSSGIAAGDITRYSPAQMTAQVEDDLAHASGLAGLGQELNLVKAHGELARQGSNFLVVRAPDDAAAARIASVARRFGASRAQRYGSLLIEELIPVGTSDDQAPESSDLGLDAQTASGAERSRAAPVR